MNDKQKKALEGYNHFISLRTHNLELANLKELDTLWNSGNKEFEKAGSEMVGLKQAINAVKTAYRQSAVQWTAASKVVDEITAQVKVLGLEVPTSVSGRSQILKDKIKEATTKITSLQNIEKSL